MITTINKDILTVDKGVIVHSVNCIGAVGGLASAIAHKWPENAKRYKKHVMSAKPSIMLLGSIFEVNVAHNLIVANLFGQNSVGINERQTEYSALITGFKRIADTVFYGNDEVTIDLDWFGTEEHPQTKQTNNILTDIYIPYKIGCGLGRADWSVVEEILHKIFGNSFKNVYICKNE